MNEKWLAEGAQRTVKFSRIQKNEIAPYQGNTVGQKYKNKPAPGYLCCARGYMLYS